MTIMNSNGDSISPRRYTSLDLCIREAHSFCCQFHSFSTHFHGFHDKVYDFMWYKVYNFMWYKLYDFMGYRLLLLLLLLLWILCGSWSNLEKEWKDIT